MRILVFGGAGFIGKHVVREIRRRGGITVTAGRSAVADWRVDALNRGDLDRFLRVERFDAMVNLLGSLDQGSSPTKYSDLFRAIVLPSVSAVESVWENMDIPVVQIGSNAEYGDSPVPQAGSSLCAPISAYGVAKLSVTATVQAKARSEGRKARIVRPFFVFGPGAPSSNFVEMVACKAAIGGNFPTSKGMQERDMVSVAHVASLIVDSIRLSDKSAKIVNACTGHPRSIRSVVELATRMSKGQMLPEFGSIPVRLGELLYSTGVPEMPLTKEEADRDLSAFLEHRIKQVLAGQI